MAARHRILIVEDSATMRQLIGFALKRIPGLEITEAKDGMDGLRQLMAAHYDLVVVDINMPVLDGLRLIQLIREEPEHNDVRIVVITTEGANADREKAMALGADAYLTKPVQAGEVLSVAKGLLRI